MVTRVKDVTSFYLEFEDELICFVKLGLITLDEKYKVNYMQHIQIICIY